MKVNILENYKKLNDNILGVCKKINRDPKSIKVVAVSKTQPINKIKVLLKKNHLNFGENRLKEAQTKWAGIEEKKRSLHFIGALQSKKVSDIVNVFNVIETLDSESAARNLAKICNKNIDIFIQINIGKELHKRGVFPIDFQPFLNMCKSKYNLSINGAMCMPPMNKEPSVYFKEMKELCHKNNIYNISMGMSNDYEEAIMQGSTNIRVGSYIFGERI